jgi:hypothetical protein
MKLPGLKPIKGNLKSSIGDCSMKGDAIIIREQVNAATARSDLEPKEILDTGVGTNSNGTLTYGHIGLRKMLFESGP